MAEQPPVRAFTFCDKHGDMTASVATIAAQTEAQTAILQDFKNEARRTIQDTLDRIDRHCSTDGHPLVLQRMGGYERVQAEQVATLQSLRGDMDAHGTRLHDIEQCVKPLPKLIDDVKYSKSWRAFLGPIIVALITLVGVVLIRFSPAVAEAAKMVAGQ